jgi:hypothetical protein
MMRRLSRCSVIVMLVGLSSMLCTAQGAPGDTVLIFNGKDGVGMSQPIPVGVFQVDGKQLGSSVSVRVPREYFVRFCAEKDGKGNCEQFGEGVHNLASVNFNFIRVWTGTSTAPVGNSTASATATVSGSAGPALIVFEQRNWGGRAQNFQSGMYRSFRGEFGKLNDNQARSVVVAKGFRARFCSEEGIYFRGAGDCEIHEEGKHNLRFGNSISFIEIKDLSDNSPDDETLPVVLYEDPLQAGKMQGFDVGNFVASRGEFKKLGNDLASSIVVRNGYRASVCSDEPVSAGGEGGNCEEFGPGRKNLKSRKTASYLRVWKGQK